MESRNFKELKELNTEKKIKKRKRWMKIKFFKKLMQE